MLPSLGPGLPGPSSYTSFPWFVTREEWLQATALACGTLLDLVLWSVRVSEEKVRERAGRWEREMMMMQGRKGRKGEKEGGQEKERG